ncbi:zinc finger and BTB domain-containing protein 24-like [Cloeon dipterum]|uniref:zinc finger and BTB domain-containing protein 24-like n=1 Tax=Cloeon dipterum TaxID=197152 RepID=UPI00321FEC02
MKMDALPRDPQAVDAPFGVKQDNFFNNLFSTIRRLEIFADCFLVLRNNEIVLSNYFIMSALSGVLNSMPKMHRAGLYLVLRDVEPWAVKWLLEYFSKGQLMMPINGFESINKIMATLDIDLLGNFFQSDELIHFSMSQEHKCDILSKIWASRHKNFDLKIITKDNHEVFAHWAVLAASSDQLCDLFQAPVSARPRLIVLLEFEAADVELLLKFCYKGEVQIPHFQAMNVCKLAKIFGIKGLYDTVTLLGYHLDKPPVTKQGTTRLTSYEHNDTAKRLLFKSLFDRETLSDLQLISNDHTFKVHSAILSISPYFKPIFNQSDWRHCLIFLSEYALETVQAFVDLVYYGEVVYHGGVQDFKSVMRGLIDFSLLPINAVEQLQPVTKDQEVLEPKLPPEKPPQETPREATGDSAKMLTYPCDICPNVFYSRKRLKAHILSEHPQTKFKCSQCGLFFESQTELKTHVKELDHRIVGSSLYFCSICSKSFTMSSSLRNHLKVHDSSHPSFECDVCHKTCSRKDYLEEHMRTHTGKKPFKCSTCGKRFVGKTGLNHHRKIHGPPRKESVCEICGKEFTRKALWTHMKIHDKQLKCSVCGQLFATSGTLKNHMTRKHYDAKNHVCEICNRAFSLRGELTRHKKVVHEDKGDPSQEHLECKQCHKKFCRSSSLRFHERSHEHQSSCKTCHKSFTSPEALKIHLESHSSENNFSCDQCKVNFRCKSSLRRHNNKKHIGANNEEISPIVRQESQNRQHQHLDRYENDQKPKVLNPEPPEMNQHYIQVYISPNDQQF